MPEVDGLDLLRYVRSNTQLVDLPVISEYRVIVSLPPVTVLGLAYAW